MNLSEATVSWIGVPVTVLGVVRGRCVGQRRWGREGRHRSKIIIQMAVGYGKQGGGLDDGNGRRPVVKEITGLAPVLRKSFFLGYDTDQRRAGHIENSRASALDKESIGIIIRSEMCWLASSRLFLPLFPLPNPFWSCQYVVMFDPPPP